MNSEPHGIANRRVVGLIVVLEINFPKLLSHFSLFNTNLFAATILPTKLG